MTRGRPNPLHFGLASRLKKARKAANLTPRGLSEKAGLSNPMVGLIEAGQVPRVDVVEKLARVLGCSPCFLAYGVEDAPPHAAEGPLACEAIGERLAQARKAGGMSKNAVGLASKTTGQTVANIEDGKTMPSVATAETLAKALRVSPCWLSYSEGEMDLPKLRRRKAPSSLTP